MNIWSIYYSLYIYIYIIKFLPASISIPWITYIQTLQEIQKWSRILLPWPTLFFFSSSYYVRLFHWLWHKTQQYFQLMWVWFLTWIHRLGKWGWPASTSPSPTSMPLMLTTILGSSYTQGTPQEMLLLQLLQVISFSIYRELFSFSCFFFVSSKFCWMINCFFYC